jgi:spore germination cell wall hydrolase CwlJ-like protein
LIGRSRNGAKKLKIIGLIIGITVMTLFSQSQTNNIESLMARIKERAFAAQEESLDVTPAQGILTRPKARPDNLNTDMVANTVRALREKADAAMASQPEIYLSNVDVEEFMSKDAPKTTKVETPVELPVTAMPQQDVATPENGIMSKPDSASIDAAVMDAVESDVMQKPTLVSEEYTKAIDEMSDMEILARTIEAEAAGEGYKGKLGVGATIANRAASGKYGDDVKGVILKKGHFSPWNSYTGHAKGEQGKDMLNLKPSKESYKAAAAILSGDYTDPTGGATHYVNQNVSKPKWLGEMKGRKVGTTKIGRHLFGNADSETTYDGSAWAKIYAETSTTPRPKARP